MFNICPEICTADNNIPLAVTKKTRPTYAQPPAGEKKIHHAPDFFPGLQNNTILYKWFVKTSQTRKGDDGTARNPHSKTQKEEKKSAILGQWKKSI